VRSEEESGTVETLTNRTEEKEEEESKVVEQLAPASSSLLCVMLLLNCLNFKRAVSTLFEVVLIQCH